MRFERSLPILGLGAALLAGPAVADDRPSPVAPEDRPAMESRIRSALERHAQFSDFPLQFEPDDMRDLLEGKIVMRREKRAIPVLDKGASAESGDEVNEDEEAQERHRILATYLIPYPRDIVWVAALDPHFPNTDRVTEYRISTTGASSVWYMYISLPWPLKDRHWVINVDRPVRVSEGTDGEAWEQIWSLHPRGEELGFEVTGAGLVEGVDLDRAQGARQLDENIGAWTLIELEDNLTLLAYQATAAMGGWIPDWLSGRFAKGQVKTLLRNAEENAKEIPTHYDSEHELIYGGNGLPMAAFAPAPHPSSSE